MKTKCCEHCKDHPTKTICVFCPCHSSPKEQTAYCPNCGALAGGHKADCPLFRPEMAEKEKQDWTPPEKKWDVPSQPSAEWEKEFDREFGFDGEYIKTLPPTLPTSDVGLLIGDMKAFTRKVVEQARADGYADGCSNPNYNDGYEEGRAATIKEVVEIIEGKKKKVGLGLAEDLHSVQAHNATLSDLKQSISTLGDNKN